MFCGVIEGGARGIARGVLAFVLSVEVERIGSEEDVFLGFGV